MGGKYAPGLMFNVRNNSILEYLRSTSDFANVVCDDAKLLVSSCLINVLVTSMIVSTSKCVNYKIYK